MAAFMDGIRTIHPFSKQDNKGLAGAYRFGKGLKSEKYDLFINLPASFSSQVLAWATQSRKRIGFSKEGSFLLLTNHYKKPGHLHRVDEYLWLLEQFTGKPLKGRKTILTAPHTDRKPGQLLINFNSEAESRRMPVEKAIAIANRLCMAFADIDIVFIGSPREAGFVQQILDGIAPRNNIINMAGKTKLNELAMLMAESSALLSTDSGPAHLANSLGTPVVALFGAGDEHNTAPYNKANLTIVRNGTLPCEPCVKNTCQLYGIPECLMMIDEMRIIEALRVYLPHA